MTIHTNSLIPLLISRIGTMRPLFKTQAIVLRKYNFRESDIIVNLLEENGSHLTMYVYGVRASRKRSSLLWEPGTKLSIDYYYYGDHEKSRLTNTPPHQNANSQTMITFKEGHILESYFDEKNHGERGMSYSKLSLLSFLLEVTQVCSQHGGNPKLFLLLEGSIRELKIATELSSCLMLLVFFETRLLHSIGLLADPLFCALCGLPTEEESFWCKPQVQFYCQKCHAQTNRFDREMAQILEWARKLRFINYKKNILTLLNQVDLILLHKNLYESLEAFIASPIKTNENLLREICKKT